MGLENVEELAGIFGYQAGSLPFMASVRAKFLNHLKVKMWWKKDFKNGLLCGRNNTFFFLYIMWKKQYLIQRRNANPVKKHSFERANILYVIYL